LVIGGFGAVGAAVGHVVGYVFAAIVVILLIYGTLLEYNQSHDSMYRPALLFSIPLLAVQGMNTIVNNIDIYMIGYFWDSSLVGEYNIALQLSNLFYPILMSLTFLLPPVLARLNSEKKYEEMRHIYQIITKWVVALTLPLLLIFVLSPQPVIGILFGENYTGTATALQILAIGNFFSVSMGLVNASLIGLGNNRLVAYLVGFQFTMNAILDYLLIPELAATGAALATAAAIISNNAVGIVLMYRQYGVHPITSRWGYIVGSATVATIVLFAIIKLTNVPSFFAILIFLLSYPIIIIKLVVEPADEELLSLVENRIGKRLTPFRRLLKLLR
jgi:O-antigen/teichoic acid export membrane protein